MNAEGNVKEHEELLGCEREEYENRSEADHE
jgi:hypothetical protein